MATEAMVITMDGAEVITTDGVAAITTVGDIIAIGEIVASGCSKSADDFLRVSQTPGTQENNWLRQALGYWGMTASFVLKGVLNEELFLEPAFSGEMFLMFAKLQPILKELREKLGDPQAFHNLEDVATRTKYGRDRLQLLAKRVEMMRQKKAEREGR